MTEISWVWDLSILALAILVESKFRTIIRHERWTKDQKTVASTAQIRWDTFIMMSIRFKLVLFETIYIGSLPDIWPIWTKFHHNILFDQERAFTVVFTMGFAGIAQREDE